MKRFIHISEYNDLPVIQEWVRCKHIQTDSYHTYEHMKTVADIANKLATVEDVSSEYVIIASLFHDFNYRNFTDDRLNVGQSIYYFCEYFVKPRELYYKQPELVQRVCKNILYTTNTEAWENANIDDIEYSIMRDADKLASVELFNFQLYYNTFGKPLNMTAQDFKISQIKFYGDLQLKLKLPVSLSLFNDKIEKLYNHLNSFDISNIK